MKQTFSKKQAGQSAIEYLILATAVTIVILIGFDERVGFLSTAIGYSEKFFNQTVVNIMGPQAGDAARSAARNYP